MVTLYWIQVIALSALSIMVGMFIVSMATRKNYSKGRDKGWDDAVSTLEKRGQIKIKGAEE